MMGSEPARYILRDPRSGRYFTFATHGMAERARASLGWLGATIEELPTPAACISNRGSLAGGVSATAPGPFSKGNAA